MNGLRPLLGLLPSWETSDSWESDLRDCCLDSPSSLFSGFSSSSCLSFVLSYGCSFGSTALGFYDDSSISTQSTNILNLLVFSGS